MRPIFFTVSTHAGADGWRNNVITMGVKGWEVLVAIFHSDKHFLPPPPPPPLRLLPQSWRDNARRRKTTKPTPRQISDVPAFSPVLFPPLLFRALISRHSSLSHCTSLVVRFVTHVTNPNRLCAVWNLRSVFSHKYTNAN